MGWWQRNTAGKRKKKRKKPGAEKSESDLHKSIERKSVSERSSGADQKEFRATNTTFQNSYQDSGMFWAGNECLLWSKVSNRDAIQCSFHGICAPSSLVAKFIMGELRSNKNSIFFPEMGQNWSSSVCCFQPGDFLNKLERDLFHQVPWDC